MQNAKTEVIICLELDYGLCTSEMILLALGLPMGRLSQQNFNFGEDGIVCYIN